MSKDTWPTWQIVGAAAAGLAAGAALFFAIAIGSLMILLLTWP